MRITVRCPQCGRIELGKQDLHVVAMPPRRSPGAVAGRAVAGGEAWYVYDCTGCAHQVVVEIPPSVVVALVTVGVPVWRVPAEFLERAWAREGLLGVDDVLDAMLWLRDATADDARAVA